MSTQNPEQQNQNLHSLFSKDLTVALELGYLKGGYVNLQDNCNLLHSAFKSKKTKPAYAYME